MDETYPDYAHVIPKGETSGVTAQFDAAHIIDASKALRALGNKSCFCKYPYIYHNGTNPGIIDTLDENIIMIIMPLGLKNIKPATFTPTAFWN